VRRGAKKKKKLLGRVRGHLASDCKKRLKDEEKDSGKPRENEKGKVSCFYRHFVLGEALKRDEKKKMGLMAKKNRFMW